MSIDELQALLAKATPRPWFHNEDAEGTEDDPQLWFRDEHGRCAIAPAFYWDHADGAATAAIMNHAEALLAVARAASTYRDALDQGHDAIMAFARARVDESLERLEALGQEEPSDG